MMAPKTQENRLLATPLVLYLLLLLGFPSLLNVFYSLSDVTFETLRTPRLSGFGNFAAVLSDPAFWRAVWFSLRFGVLTATVEVALGLFLAVFLSPLLQARPWLLALLTKESAVGTPLLAFGVVWLWRSRNGREVGSVRSSPRLIGWTAAAWGLARTAPRRRPRPVCRSCRVSARASPWPWAAARPAALPMWA